MKFTGAEEAENIAIERILIFSSGFGVVLNSYIDKIESISNFIFDWRF